MASATPDLRLPSQPPILHRVTGKLRVSPKLRVPYFLLLLILFNGLFSRITWASGHQKGKTSLDLNEARDDGVWGFSVPCLRILQ